MTNQTAKLSNLKVGLTIFIGLVIFFLFLFLVGNESNFWGSSYNLKIFVENSEGLSNGSLVSLGGLKIGSISELEFTKKNGTNGIDITLSIDERYKNQITNSSVASIKTFGLLGDKYIDISIGQPYETPLASNSYLPIKPSYGLDKLSAKAEPAINDLTKLLNNLRNITDTISSGKGSIGKLIYGSKIIDKLQSVLDNLSKFTSAMNSQRSSVGKLIADTTLYDRLNILALNLNDITSQIKEGKGSLGKLIMQDTVYNNVSSISKRLDKLIAKTETDSTLAGALFNDKKMYNQFKQIINDINTLLQEIKKDPQKYLRITVF